ncbi:MAG: BCSC C-terminal domain-containing protein [Alphaproteobacteria bacterium]|nr:BCSC C-terminal domain-containing protein [Alphaproteobacteria bacterium]
MKSSRGTLAFGLLLSVAVPSGLAVAVDAGEQLMLERAEYWRAQQRPDLAGNILNKLLALNPAQPDALYRQGLLELARGNRDDADALFERLRHLAADNARAAELTALLPAGLAGRPAALSAAEICDIPDDPPAAVQGAVAAAAPATAATAMPTAPAVTASAPTTAASADSDDLAPAKPRPAAPPRAVAHRRPVAPATVAAADSDDLIPGAPTLPSRRPGVPGEPAAAVLPTPPRLQRLAAAAQTVSDLDSASAREPIDARTADSADLPAGAAGRPAARTAGSADLRASPRSVQVAQVELQPPPPIDGYQRNAAITYSPNDTLEVLIDRNLEQIEAEANPTLIAGLGFRAHSGDQGLNRLNEVGGSFEGSFSPWYTGTARVAVLPVYLDANGAVTAGELNLFGANPILAARGVPLVPSGEQNATGVGILGSYTYRDFSGQIGTSPLGFPVTNLVGNVAFTPKFFNDTLSVRLEGLRQPVTDSVLSYAGTHASLGAANALTGGAFGNDSTWGGVVKTGGHVTAYYDDQDFFGAYGGAGAAVLTGKNVAENSTRDALLGIYFRPWRGDNWVLRVGVSAFYAGYDKNLSGFTFGQGGYFSPQNYEVLTFPVEYTGHAGPWSWLASAALGVQHFNADSSLVFPHNPAAQSALALAGGNTILAGTEETGPAFNFKGQLEYQIDRTLAIGASASLDNSNNYVEGIGKIYLRKTFDWFAPVADSDPASIAARDQPRNRL